MSCYHPICHVRFPTLRYFKFGMSVSFGNVINARRIRPCSFHRKQERYCATRSAPANPNFASAHVDNSNIRGHSFFFPQAMELPRSVLYHVSLPRFVFLCCCPSPIPDSAIGVSHRNVYHYTTREEIMLQCTAVGDGFRCLVEGLDVPQGCDCFSRHR